MTIANTIVLLKKSATPGNAPSALANGEVAINYADGKLYYKNTSGVITYISSGATTNSFATINANSSLIFATSNTDILSIAPGNNITISTNTISKTITINSTTSGYQYFSSNNTTVYTSNVSINNTLSVTNATQTANVVTNIIQSTTATTAQTAIDTWSTTTYRTAKYIISMTSGTNYHGIELFVVQNGTTPYITQYAEVITNTSLATFDASITSGTLSLLVNPASSTSTTYNILRDLISV
jgi:hypothetical protein